MNEKFHFSLPTCHLKARIECHTTIVSPLLVYLEKILNEYLFYRRENASCVSSHHIQITVFREGSVRKEYFPLIVVVPTLRKLQHYENI